MVLDELTEAIIGACYEVSNELGAGFLESVYEKALLICLHEKGLNARSQVPVKVEFRKQIVGDFYADVIVENSVLVELKATKDLAPEHVAQVLNYLRATDIKAGLLINFGNPKLQVRRFNHRMTNAYSFNRDKGDEQDKSKRYDSEISPVSPSSL